MRTGLNIVVVWLFFGRVVHAQTTYAVQDTAYKQAVERAFTSLKQGDCQPCLDSYRKAFAISQKSALSSMRAALCAYQCKQTDLVKRYIQQAIDIDYDIAEDVWVDYQTAPEFNAFRNTTLKDYVQEAFARKDALVKYNLPLKRELQTIYASDQQPRSRIDSIINAYGQDSPQMRQFWQQTHLTDSINTARIEQIIQQYGYPGKSLVGSKQGNTAWLVIQHAPLPIQEKYLPLMRKAANEGEMDKPNLALLIDRIRMYKGQKQIYGSQITLDASGKWHFHRIEDEANVNKRRAEMELDSIEEHARNIGVEYKPAGK